MGLTIIDISTPSSPVLAGYIQGEGAPNYLSRPTGLAVSGNYAYVHCGGDDCVTVIDITDKANPVYSNRLSGAGAPNYLGGPGRGQIVGDYDFVGSTSITHSYNALVIIDISTPTAISLKGEIHGSSDNKIDNPIGIHVVGSYAYIASHDDVCMTVIDVSDPANPSYKGRYYVAEGGSARKMYQIQDVRVVGNYAYCISGSDWLTVLDVSNPATPTFVGALDLNASGEELPNPRHIRIVGDYAFITSNLYDAFGVVNISNPASPTYVTRIRTWGETPNYLDSAYGLDIVGDYAYITSITAKSLTIIDISTPTSPSLVSYVMGAAYALNNPLGVVVIGNYAYIACAQEVSIPATVTTQAMTEVKAETATGDGTVTDLGTSDPTQHGHCWSTSPSPTIADDKTELGPKTATGAFTSSLTELTPKTLYYCRAYATNIAGTGYGTEVTFTTRARVLGNPNIDQLIYQHVERMER